MHENLANYSGWRGFDSRRLHHTLELNQCLSDSKLRQLWLQWSPVVSDKAALRQPPRVTRHTRPWSARPTLFCIPSRLSAARRREHLLEIEDRCIITLSGCWLYPALREGYPYIDVTGDDGEREQWAARRYVWGLVNGDIPEGGIILGNCPPKACVNEAHQWLWVPPKQFDLFGYGRDSTAVRHV